MLTLRSVDGDVSRIALPMWQSPPSLDVVILGIAVTLPISPLTRAKNGLILPSMPHLLLGVLGIDIFSSLRN